MKPFYVVWNPPTGYTKFRHSSIKAAVEEAKRLALAHPNQEFIVLAPVSTSKKVDVQTTMFIYDPENAPIPDLEDEIPF